MKKLLIALGVAFSMAAIANAAAVTWRFQASNAYTYDGSSSALAMADDIVVSLYALDANGNAVSDFSYSETITPSFGKLTSSTFTTEALSGFKEGESYTFYLSYVVNGWEFTLPEDGYVTATATTATTGTLIDFKNISAYSKEANNWTPAPEPTSGLLLLLGMAGLALRRKKA